ncbi:MAG: L,D-transpeptidase family protein [Epsilonproteobacteria bacterium]|nr:L,D-transpeptidase family protein [Campylobacterota bacterium]
MKKLFFLLLVTYLWGDYTILDRYRMGYEYIKQMDMSLYSDTYINHLLQNKDVTFGYFDNPTNIIVCYKKDRIVDVYNLNSKLTLKHQFKNILIGKNAGDKWQEGDGKTPIGVYILKHKLNDNEIDDFYGPLAYPTNYPNLYDSYLGKSGHGIWIHGFPKSNPNRKFDTKGCIALPNNELIKFSKLINYKNAILIINTQKLPQTNKQQIGTILKELFKWRFAWKYNQLDKYLSFYDKDNFKKENRYNFDEFAKMKKRIFMAQKNKEIKFRNIKIIPYPHTQDNIFKVSFDEIFKANNYNFKGNKTLYLRLLNDKISIFLEN